MLLSICDSGEVLSAMRIIKILIQIIRIAVPIILIISLILTYVGAMTSNDSEALAKANKSIVPKSIAIVLVFLMPTFVRIVADISSTENGWKACITNANSDGINAAYRQDAENRINKANETLNEGDYNTALSYIRKIKDESVRSSLESELGNTKKYIELKKEINRLNNSYSDSQYSSIKSKIEAVGDENAKKKLLSLLEDVKKSHSETATSTSPTSGSPITVSTSGKLNTFTASTGRTITYYVDGPKNLTSNLPLIVYLHGDGSVYDVNNLTYGEMTAYVKQIYGDNPPFVYLLPHTEITNWTDGNRPQSVIELIDKIIDEYKVNKSKIILSGGSRGAMGAWFIANQYASKFSAFFPISGTGNINSSNFRNLPTKAVVSTDGSDSWCYSNMQSNCNSINSAGGKCTFVPMNGYTHNTILGGAFTKANFEWMISQ